MIEKLKLTENNNSRNTELACHSKWINCKHGQGVYKTTKGKSIIYQS